MLMYQGYLQTRYEALDDGCEAARSIPPPGTDDRTDVCDERWGRARKGCTLSRAGIWSFEQLNSSRKTLPFMKTQKATRYTIVWPTFEYNSQVVPASVEKSTKYIVYLIIYWVFPQAKRYCSDDTYNSNVSSLDS